MNFLKYFVSPKYSIFELAWFMLLMAVFVQYVDFNLISWLGIMVLSILICLVNAMLWVIANYGSVDKRE